MTTATIESPVAHAHRIRRWCLANPLLMTGLLLLSFFVLVAIFAPILAPYPADAGSATHPLNSLQPPSAKHWFGTDLLGRDVLSRCIFGARTSLLVVAAVLLIACAIGVPLGITAGYFSGVVDTVIMRITDVFLAFPPLLLALTIAFVFTPSVRNMTLAIAAAWWPLYARLARGEAASVSRRPYVESSRAIGVRSWRIVFRHVLPNATTPVIVQVSLGAGSVLLTAAAISFLGLGAQAPTPEWGLMVSEGQSYFNTQWWLVTFPGICILLLALAFNLLGEGLRELLDPRRIITR